MISRLEVYNGLVSAIKACSGGLPVRKWNRNIEEMDDSRLSDAIYVAPYAVALEESQEIGAITYERSLYYEVAVVMTDRSGTMASERVMPVMDSIEAGLHGKQIAGWGVAVQTRHPEAHYGFQEFYMQVHAGRIACIQLWAVVGLESHGD